MLNQLVTDMRPAEVAARDDLVLVDVRESEERAHVRAPASVHIPLDDVQRRLAELPRDRTVAFICRSGARSAVAARVAAGHGVHAANVDGGMLAWVDAGLPVETGPESPKEGR